MTLTEAIDLLAEHGFTALDLPAHLSTEAAEETAAHIRKRSLHAHMTHLPNWRYEKNPDYDAHQKEMLRCAETSRILGVDLMVAHCDEFDFNNMEYTKERAIEFNYRYFYPIVEFAAKHGMKVAFETVFEDIGKPRLGSIVEELLEFTEKFDCKTVGVCWDSGHTKMQYPSDYNRALETIVDRVICTHVHDNYYRKDLHVFPFLGDTNWEETMKILKEHGYSNPFTIELAYGKIPTKLLGDYLDILRKSVEYLWTLP